MTIARKIAVVLVHYHTPELVAAAHAALQADLDGAGLTAEWLLVDNGSHPEDRELFAGLPLRRLDPGANLGYAGGANLGFRESAAEAVFLMNPDVLVQPGCAAALLAALENGAAVAGPRFYWDREGRFLLPPTERRTRRDEFLRFLAERGPFWARWGRRRWRRHARRFWTAEKDLAAWELSGALLAIRREAWAAVGGFDEAYRLYFEENDFLERLRRKGRKALFVPRAEAVHLYAQSSMGEPRAGAWFADSHRLFQQRHYGTLFARFLERLGRWWPAAPALPDVLPPPGEGRAAWLEVSASRLGYPAAAKRLGADEEVGWPAEMTAQMPPGVYRLRTVSARGRELGLRVTER